MKDDHRHHEAPESPAALRTKAIESLLVEKELIASDAVDAVVETYERDIGPMNGAKVVARAWCDPEYRKRLLEVGREGAQIVVLENTPGTHNLVVCTLCSCYPWPVLGLPPSWYKSFAYRSRAVSEPRSVLKEFGLELEESVEVRVWDSTAEVRYMVLPLRPAGTEDLGEEELVPLVSRDSMIGAVQAAAPDQAGQ